ncbi:MAG: xanthine dehydrogenase family protein molybdopterin-binding subunit [Proteobacteria bacterium]|nr:xanthine dehydrogenase family protein molybdopterin-binding subunit [Burkholderiales bacterium]
MIGQALDRRDGTFKVTGRAAYSYERQDAGQAAHGYMVGAAVAKGRIVAIDVAMARRAPGVALVMTHQDVAPQGARDGTVAEQFARPWPVLIGDEVAFFGQPVALVVADTFEQARAAAALVVVTYATDAGAFDLAAHRGEAYTPKMAAAGFPADTCFGDLDRAMADTPVNVDVTYTTPHHFAQPMEPAACLASWNGDDLAVCVSVQGIAACRNALARTLLIAPERVHVDAAFVGGGFGSKLRLHEETVLAALASRRLQRPVKVAHTRRQVFNIAGHGPEMIHRVRLAARRDGTLLGIGHDVNMQGARREEYVEQAATVLRSLYAAPHRLTRHRVTNLDLNLGEAVRGPGEAPGLLAVESAMDELAIALDLDPIELRIRNEPDLDPERRVSFSGRRLVECMREGASRFGWAARPRRPASRREGDVLVGFGMSASIRACFQGATAAIVRMEPDGRVIVKSDMTDIGTGTLTILAQVAAGALNVPIAGVSVQLARSDLPVSAGSGGSWGASNTCNAVYRACDDLRRKVMGPASLWGREADLASEVARRFPDGVEGEGILPGMQDDPNYKEYSVNTYGANFAEVGVDVTTGEVRLRRMLGVFCAGRIVNPKTARSQVIGGMIWGVGAALHEAAHVDPRYGNFVNGDLAEYLVPVHADIPAIDAIMLDDFDDKANPLGIKGVGELGICGSGAAVANAVFNATGIRVRDFPITIEKLLPGLPVR